MPVGHTALPDLQAAITLVLQASAAFNAVSKGIFDPAPQGQAFPYVTFGNHIESPFLTFGNLGRGTVMLLHIWSQSFGYAEAYNILNVINSTIDAQQATGLTNFNNVIMLYMGANKFSDPDGITRHLVARYRTWNTAL